MAKLFKVLTVTLLVALTLTSALHVHNDECGYFDTGICTNQPRHEDRPPDFG